MHLQAHFGVSTPPQDPSSYEGGRAQINCWDAFSASAYFSAVKVVSIRTLGLYCHASLQFYKNFILEKKVSS